MFKNKQISFSSDRDCIIFDTYYRCGFPEFISIIFDQRQMSAPIFDWAFGRFSFLVSLDRPTRGLPYLSLARYPAAKQRIKRRTPLLEDLPAQKPHRQLSRRTCPAI
jgi:hypothetical protein